MQHTYGPPEQPPLDDDARPVTRGDLRGVRRWLLVAGVWAVAASAIALIALLEQDGSANRDQSAALARQVSRAQRHLDRRIDSLQQQVQQLPQSEDVRNLDNRLAKVEDRSSQAAKDARQAREDVSSLEDRVKDLEREQGSGGQSQP